MEGTRVCVEARLVSELCGVEFGQVVGHSAESQGDEK